MSMAGFLASWEQGGISFSQHRRSSSPRKYSPLQRAKSPLLPVPYRFFALSGFAVIFIASPTAPGTANAASARESVGPRTAGPTLCSNGRSTSRSGLSERCLRLGGPYARRREAVRASAFPGLHRFSSGKSNNQLFCKVAILRLRSGVPRLAKPPRDGRDGCAWCNERIYQHNGLPLDDPQNLSS